MPARIIFKAHYLSGHQATHIENYIQYMGTRPGVEIFADDGSPATEKQKQLIEQLIDDLGKEMTESYEYEDYLLKPTKANASAAITACMDAQYARTSTKENYIDYIANRPRVEKLGEHGLFAQTDARLDLEQIADEVAHQGNNVWTDIISLRRADAEKMGFDNAAAWRDLLRSKVETIARNYKIPMRDFVWYAAFHDEGHHPHVHFVCYSKAKDGYLTEKGIENIKSALAHEIFKQEFSEIYGRQTQLRSKIKEESSLKMEQLARSLSDAEYEDTELKDLIVHLASRLDELPGKKQYGCLPKDTKNLVDAITERFAQHATIAKLYDLWYEQKEEIVGVYQSSVPERLPLSENKEFTSVKNMIIREVSELSFLQEFMTDNLNFESAPPYDDIDEMLFDDADDTWLYDFTDDRDMSHENVEPVPNASDISDVTDDIEVLIPQKGAYHSTARKSSVDKSQKLYRSGIRLLKAAEIIDAIDCFKLSAEQGNRWASYRLGKIFLEGKFVQKDIAQSIAYLEVSANQDNDMAMYTLGKLYLADEDVPKDILAAVDYFEKAAEQGNSFAQYQLGKLYMIGEDLPQDINLGIQYLEQAIESGNDAAMCFLGRAYLFGDPVPKNIKKGLDLLQAAADQGNEYAEKMIGDFHASTAHAAISILHKLSMMLQPNTAVMAAKQPVMPAVDKKELIAILRKKAEEGIRYD